MMRFIRRRYQILFAFVIGPAGVLLTSTAAHAVENWGS